MEAVAVVLAAGAGKRMDNRAKAALLLPDGRTFLAAVAASARAGGCREVVVVVGPPHALETKTAAQAAGVTKIAENPDPERGMASSLAVALARLDPHEVDVALVWPVDHALVRAGTVEALLRASGRDLIVVPTDASGRGGHPTAFGASLWPELRNAAVLPDGARAVVRADRTRVVRVPVSDPGVFFDVDTPDDLREVRTGDTFGHRQT
ncbi:MAG: nucleotidyltransferase family protein [Deltaproteobacteria bacterium]|nr:nucleotidyltransferase family protein [Deltaproteobacteria bacterium]